MKTTRWFAAALAIVTLSASGPAFASFHIMQIEQVIGGVGGDVNAQAIQLRLRADFQNLVQSARLRARDAAGNNPVTVCDMGTPVSNSAGGAHVLITTPGFAAYCGATPDFTMTPIPPSYLAAGSLTFESDAGAIYWRLSWGGAGYTGPGTGLTTNDTDGNFNPPFAGALPSGSLAALRFTGPFFAANTNNAADYQVTAGAATFTNNAGAPCTVTQPLTGCSIAAGIDLLVTPGNGQTRHDFSGAPIPAGFFGPGSDPFAGPVVLAGQPISPSSPLGPTDTIVRRLQDAMLPAPGSQAGVPIEIVALSLVSVNPIIVTYNGGQNPEPWNVRMCLSSVQPQQQGTLNLTADPCACPEGGTFSAALPVLPKFVFTRPMPAATRTFDFASQGRFALPFFAAGHWLQVTGPGFTPIQVPAGQSIDHDCDGDTPVIQLPASGSFYLGARAMRCDSVACVTPVSHVPRVTRFADGAAVHVHDVVPATACNTDGDGDGVCDDADNCAAHDNAAQSDLDDDGIGDLCDNCPTIRNSCQEDEDMNGIGDLCATSGVEDHIAARVQLGPVIPNPNRGSLAFTVSLPRPMRVRLGIYDVRGRLMRGVADQILGAGLHHLRWSGRLPSDQYLLRLEADGVGRTQKFTVIH